MYAIQATVRAATSGGGVVTRQVPTFYLDENVQGIVSEEHARQIAAEILWSVGLPALAAELTICAVQV